ncbi:MAG: hypothetical protein U0326_09520 [Polyangiales bacterium]
MSPRDGQLLMILPLMFGLAAGCSDDSTPSGTPVFDGSAPPADASTQDRPDAAPPPAPELGVGHTPDAVTLTAVIEGLAGPTAIAFNPDAPTQFWVTNRDNDSLTIVDTAGQTPATPLRIRDRSAHFLIYPSSIAFSSDQTVGTCQESENDYRGRSAPNEFMGPVISPTDLAAIRNTPTNAHFDMVHHSPLCMGIANVAPREFWVFNGQSGSIDKYLFHEWHAPGAMDHADGETWRFADGQLSRVETVPSHMVFDASSGMLYVADTGNSRIVRLDTRVETTADMPRLRTPIRETPLYGVPDSNVEEVVGAAGELRQPSGLALRDGLLYVGDYANARISAFRLSGERVNWLDTGLGENTLTGIAFGPDGRLFAVDRAHNRVVRVDPR